MYRSLSLSKGRALMAEAGELRRAARPSLDVARTTRVGHARPLANSGLRPSNTRSPLAGLAFARHVRSPKFASERPPRSFAQSLRPVASPSRCAQSLRPVAPLQSLRPAALYSLHSPGCSQLATSARPFLLIN